MSTARYDFTPPTLKPLRWLTDPGSRVSPAIRGMLLGELFASPKAVAVALLNGVLLNVVALYLHSGIIFALFMLIDVALVVARIRVVRSAIRAATCGKPTPTDLYLITASSWCALQGAMAFTAMITGTVTLQLLGALSVIGLIGPICARNYAAPRYALMLVLLCDLPCLAGAVLCGNHLMLLFIPQTPLLLFGAMSIVRRFQAIAITALEAEQDGRHRARHDSLTGLLNRFGLMEALDAHYATSQRFIMFYLDLDGFKPINDTFGHHAGDKMLRAVAERLRAVIRADDIVARLGGDEFVIIAPNMPPHEGENLANSIIRRVATEAFMIEEVGPLRIGISIGFACVPEDADTGDDLHRKADAALYEAKAAGKCTHRRFGHTKGSRVPTACS